MSFVYGGLSRLFLGDGGVTWTLPAGNPLDNPYTNLRISFWWQPSSTTANQTILALNSDSQNEGIIITQVGTSPNIGLRLVVKTQAKGGSATLITHNTATISGIRDFSTTDRIQSWRFVAFQVGIVSGQIVVGSTHNGSSASNSEFVLVSDIPVSVTKISIARELSGSSVNLGNVELMDLNIASGLWGNQPNSFVNLPASSFNNTLADAPYGESVRTSLGSSLIVSDNWRFIGNDCTFTGATTTQAGTIYRMLGAPVSGITPASTTTVFVHGDSQRFTTSTRTPAGAYEKLGRLMAAHVQSKQTHQWHVGDWVHNLNNLTDRDRIRAFMTTLRSEMYGNNIPLIGCLGNHEFNGNGSSGPNRRLTRLLGTDFFPVESPCLDLSLDVLNQPDLVDSFVYNGSPATNDPDRSAEWSAHFVSNLGGRPWNIFALTTDSWGPVIDWLVHRMNQPPYIQYPTVIVTHHCVAAPNLSNFVTGPGWSPSVRQAWLSTYQRLVSDTVNLRMTFSGHVISDWQVYVVDSAQPPASPLIDYIDNIPVIHVSVNGQEQTAGGDGMIRMLQFENDEVHISTFNLMTGFEAYPGGGSPITATFYTPQLIYNIADPNGTIYSESLFERIMRAIRLRLLTLNQQNGYQFDLAGVVRPSREGGYAPRHLLAILRESDEQRSSNDDSAISFSTFEHSVTIDLIIRPSDDDSTPAGTIRNNLRSDVEKCLTQDVTFGGLALDSKVVTAELFDVDNGEFEGISLRFMVMYRHPEENPFPQIPQIAVPISPPASSGDCVFEQLMDAIDSRLQTVTTGNGYNYTLSDVVRPSREGGYIPRHLLAILRETADERVIDSQSVGMFTTYRHVVAIDLITRTDDDSISPIGTVRNVLRADVERALMIDHTFGGLAVDSRILSPENFLVDEGSFEGLTVQLQVTYRHIETDPYSNGA